MKARSSNVDDVFSVLQIRGLPLICVARMRTPSATLPAPHLADCDQRDTPAVHGCSLDRSSTVHGKAKKCPTKCYLLSSNSMLVSRFCWCPLRLWSTLYCYALHVFKYILASYNISYVSALPLLA